MKFIDIIKTANHNLFRSKTRTFLTILAIFIGSFTIVLSNAINAGVNDFIDKQVDSIGGEGYIEIAPAIMMEEIAAMMGNSSEIKEYNPEKGSGTTAVITDEELEKIRQIDGMKSAQFYYLASAEYITSPDTTKKYNINLNVLPSNSLHTDMLAGRQVNSDSNAHEIMLTENFVKALGYDSNDAIVGQTVTLGIKQTAKCYTVANQSDCIATFPVTVTGVLAPGVLSTGPSARVNLAANNAIYQLSMEGVPESTRSQTSFVLGDADPDKIPEIKTALEKLNLTAVTVDDEVGMIRTFFDVILIVFNIFGSIALLAAAIGIINTLFMSVQERTREIGLDKALGMSSGRVFATFSAEAILLGFWGSVIGIAISMLIGYAVNSVAHETFLSDFPTFELVIFHPLNMLIITGIIMLIAFIAGTLPARAAARKDPIEALRYE